MGASLMGARLFPQPESHRRKRFTTSGLLSKVVGEKKLGICRLTSKAHIQWRQDFLHPLRHTPYQLSLHSLNHHVCPVNYLYIPCVTPYALKTSPTTFVPSRTPCQITLYPMHHPVRPVNFYYYYSVRPKDLNFVKTNIVKILASQQVEHNCSEESECIRFVVYSGGCAWIATVLCVVLE